MRRVLSSPLVALTAGLGLRLFFVLRFPANSGDAVLYEQFATNWLKHHIYAMNVNGVVTPVDMRMPGYPAFLAIIYAITGQTGVAARKWVLLSQIFVDLAGCLAIAWLAATLAFFAYGKASPRRAFKAALWLAVLCPFTANYAAVPLTEVFASLFTGIGLFFFCLLLLRLQGTTIYVNELSLYVNQRPQVAAALAGFAVGLGTLFRPETPLLLVSCWLALAGYLARRGQFTELARIMLSSGLACGLALAPWVIRNAITLHEFQPLAPKYSNLPSEMVPRGFMAWEKTWLYRVSDFYLVSWKLNDEAIELEQIPARAFDSPEEQQRVADILETYNDEITLTPEEDAAFAQLARERTSRHPLRTYLILPIARSFTIWFTPRIELIPVSGHVFPLQEAWEDDKLDQSVTIGFFLLNILYIALALGGARCLWLWNSGARPAVVLLLVFILLRTAFLTTIETPEPRYVLVCFPALIALAAQLFARRRAALIR
jgi:hypothetical protein